MMGRKKAEKFEPVGDDIDAPVVADVLSVNPDPTPTLGDVVVAEKLAAQMQAFFTQDYRWALCEAAIQQAREAKKAMFLLTEIKPADLFKAHEQYVHYGEALDIMRSSSQNEAVCLRIAYENALNAERPLLDAIAREVDDDV